MSVGVTTSEACVGPNTITLEETLMQSRCRCGSPVRYRFCQVACIECSEGCCPACTVVLESATYCVRCADSILFIPSEPPKIRRSLGRFRRVTRRQGGAATQAALAGTS